ncbi:MAG: hypothetical protein A2W99_00400 [Bacteroidetes bacterium GWF2_33_16]|nr:MAG: hypothetical protein A2X00_03105 [Bacteroidetes bacterium GWE2_32_14]OFY08733.1 MAG: hypothetical protein A2W99_00400 [Bacteroidetes bacterium GWF2_33_16]
MKSIISLAVLSFTIIACSPTQSKQSENSIIGSWQCLSGCDANIYVFSKSKKGFDYISYKDQKIVKTGTFTINDSLLTLSSDDGVSDIYMAELRNDSLILEKGKIILKFYIEETDFSNHTDELIGGMEDLLKVFPDFDFGSQEPVDFQYKVKIIEDQYETFTIAGIGVKSTIRLAGEFINAEDVISRITGVVLEQGFKPDKLNDSENCKAYKDENMVVKICTKETRSEQDYGELNIVINFGFIN